MDALAAEMAELPSGCSPDQKSYLGFFDAGGDLIAVLDLIRGYPAERSAFIGFFMVDASRQGAGVGSLLISQLLDRLRGEGVSRVRLAYVEGNVSEIAYKWPDSQGLCPGITAGNSPVC